MSLARLVDIVHSGWQEGWTERNKEAVKSLFDGPDRRYPKAAAKTVKLRAPEMNPDTGVPFAAYIPPESTDSGAYSGLSFVLFPVKDRPSLLGLVVGTAGLSPDEAILGRPGHARKAQAICAWLNAEFGHGELVAWAKHDPTRTDLDVPQNVTRAWAEYSAVFGRYGKEAYALFRPTGDRRATEEALTALLDLLFEERGQLPLSEFRTDRDKIQSRWFEHLMPCVERAEVASLLRDRRYLILQGPPGTGKTRMAVNLLHEDYAGRGRSVQFHPNTTYENFIGGLTPSSTDGNLGFRFEPAKGFLMQAAEEALKDPAHDYLLHIDEINRADLGKILGEAIFLLEPADEKRRIQLSYDFGEPFQTTFFLPPNLHILGTMNSADRSIAIVDVAVRRRFAFVSLWPRMSVVEELGCDTTKKAFRELVSIFVEHAAEDALPLVPGHSYFLEGDEGRAKQSLKTNLAPLLEEYLVQGYVGGFAEPIRAYLQWLRSL